MNTIKIVQTPQGKVNALHAGNGRQTFVAQPTIAAGQAARVRTLQVPAVRASNARNNSPR